MRNSTEHESCTAYKNIKMPTWDFYHNCAGLMFVYMGNLNLKNLFKLLF